MSSLKIVLAQINPIVGDIDGNVARILEAACRAQDQYGADIVVYPELTLTGYPPEDLLLRPSLGRRIERAISRLKAAQMTAALVVGYPKKRNSQLFNMAGVIHNQQLLYEYAKQCLPNYQVFDEKRYFTPGDQCGVFTFNGVLIGISICEDIWEEGPLKKLSATGIKILLNLNGSPFHANKQHERETLIQNRARGCGFPIVYVNQVGGQDELVFDGGSCVVDKNGDVVSRIPQFTEQLALLTYHPSTDQLDVPEPLYTHPTNALQNIYQALVLGVRDYVNKNRFTGVVVGLSGGIDSALTLAIAVDALGAERVHAVMMPFHYTSQLSQDDAKAEAERLGVDYRIIEVAPMFGAFTEALQDSFIGRAVDTTEENLQARIRGVLLMALSNKMGWLVLTTGNKSEMAVGYATLYGDMAGGLDVLKDVPKTTVFELAKYRNTISDVIPDTVITRPPSAELAPNQQDQDSLPPYEILDRILELYIENDASAADIIEAGFEPEQVNKVLRLVDLNEYKRRQAPIGIRISRRAFGRDRRYPITNGWQIGD